MCTNQIGIFILSDKKSMVKVPYNHSLNAHTFFNGGDSMEIFIKPSKKVSLTKKDRVLLSDVAEVCCVPDAENNKKIGNIPILVIDKDNDRQYLISAIDIVKKVAKVYPEADIQCLGETETLIDYLAKPEKQNKIFEKIKIIFVCVVLFGGAMTAIMSFHSDAQIPTVFQNMYKIFFGVESSKP